MADTAAGPDAALEEAPAAGAITRAARLAALSEAAQQLVEAAKAPNTLRAYRSDWRHFTEWCAGQGLDALPAEPATVALYVADLAGSGALASTIQRRLSSISQAHQAHGTGQPSRTDGPLPSPTSDYRVRQVMRGVRRTLGVAPRNQKDPLDAGGLRRLVETCPADTMAGRRDRALLLVGHLGAFRRSELVALDVDDLEWRRDGLRIHVRRSKTDQEAEGLVKAVPRGRDATICAVRALEGWIAAAEIASGPLWHGVDRHDNVRPGRLTDRAVALVVKRACLRAGLDPDRHAGHSLRSGFATAAAEGGAPERAIMRQGGWTSEAMVRRYIRMADLFRDNAATFIDL